MWTMNLRLRLVVGMVCMLFVGGACADDGAVPKPEPDPVPEPNPETTEPYLEVSPTVLRFDVAGNALDEETFVVKSNCSWKLEIPEHTDWLTASGTSGNGDATVSFQLAADSGYHAASLIFTAKGSDGQTVLSQTVEVLQGTKPVEVDPTEPTVPTDPDKEPSGPSNPGDSSGSGDSGDSNDDPNQNSKPDDGTNPAPDPDTNPDPQPGPEVPPVVSAAPNIIAAEPTSLLWAAEDRDVTKSITVRVDNFDNQVLNATISGANRDRFKTISPVRNDLVVHVTNVGPNETDADYTASLIISIEGGNSLQVPLKQSKRSTPDSSEGNDKNDGNSDDDTESGGGHDDFSHLNPLSSYVASVTTPAGWTGENCAVFSGGGPNSAPYYPSLLGMDADVRGLSMNGNTTRVGKIISPVLHGGCGKLSFDYGITNEGDERVDFKVEIIRNGGIEKVFTVQNTVECLTKYTLSEEVHVSGDFQIRFTNNCPSGQSKDADCYTIFHIEWTGEKR